MIISGECSGDVTFHFDVQRVGFHTTLFYYDVKVMDGMRDSSLLGLSLSGSGYMAGI